MKRFEFRLEAVRRIREQEEQQVQAELAAALRERVLIQQRLDASREAESQLHMYLRTNQLSARELAHISRFDELHRQKIVDANSELHFHDQKVSRIRERLVVAQARREALDRLKARQREDHRRRMLAEEARELDEVAQRRTRGPLTARSWQVGA